MEKENYTVSENYTGNRNLYDNIYKREKFKEALFDGKATTKDYITGETLHLKRQMATNKYGKARANYHTGQVDHIVPLEQVHSMAKKISFLTDEDVRAAANSEWNYRFTQSHLNQSKQSKSNFDMAQKYLLEGKYEESAKLLGDGVVANAGVSAELTIRAMKNAGESAVKNIYGSLQPNASHLARKVEKELLNSTKELKQRIGEDLNGAAIPLIVSSVNALVSVTKNEKTLGEAGKDIAKQTGTVIVTTEAQRVCVDVANHALKNSGVNILKQTAKANVIAHAVTIGFMLKDAAMDWLDGNLSDAEFVEQVSRKGTTLFLESLGATIGQTVIPIPIVGAVVGSIVTSVACGAVFSLMDAAKNNASEEKRNMISAIAADALREMKQQQEILQKYIADDAQKWNKNVNEGFSLIYTGTKANDVAIIAGGLDCILTNFNKRVRFSSLEEFDDFFMNEDSVLEL